MAKINTIRNLADDIIVLLEKKDAPIDVKVLEELSDVDHKKFKLVIDFLVEFKIINYDKHNHTVKLNNSILLGHSDQELSSDRIMYKRFKVAEKQEKFSGTIDCKGISFGYVLDGETVQDLQ